jgi:hypothetical protein
MMMSSGFYSQNGRWPDPKSSKQKGGSLALLVQRARRIAIDTILILPRVARSDRIEQRKG